MSNEVKVKMQEFLDGCSREDLWQIYAWILQRIHGKVVHLEKERAEFNAN